MLFKWLWIVVLSTVGKYWGFQLHPETDQHRYFRNSVIRPSQDRNTTHITSPITFSGISAQLRFRIVPILPEFAGFIDICTAHYFPCFPVSLRMPSDYSLCHPLKHSYGSELLLTAFMPFYNCFGYAGQAATSSHPGSSAYELSRNITLIPLDALAPVLKDGPTQIDGCSGYRRHYIKEELPNDKYKVACQMRRCYINSGGDTVTCNWMEYFDIEEGELCRSKHGKELLDDYLLRKGYWWRIAFPV